MAQICAALVFTVLIALGITACGAQEVPPRREAVDGVYRVICQTPLGIGLGSAFGHRSGRIITAAHVVAPCDVKTIALIDSSGNQTNVTRVDPDALLDLALITPSTKDFVKVPLELSTATQILIGGQVVILGFPGMYPGKEALLVFGHLAGVPTIDGIQRWAINAAINGGNSGGPVLDARTGKVIGVISSKYTPRPQDLDANIEELAKSQSTDVKKIAAILKHLREQTQLVIGFSVTFTDLQKFLRRYQIDP
jgi:S1-C subfamily serine protease